MDPRHRLNRVIPGDALPIEPAARARLLVRSEVEERPSPVPERDRGVRTGDRRQTELRVTVGPNAPQMIRLVRHPFVLAIGRPTRVDAGDTRRERLARTPLSQLVDLGADRWDRARTVNPFRSIGLGPDARPRPSIDAWLDDGSEVAK